MIRHRGGVRELAGYDLIRGEIFRENLDELGATLEALPLRTREIFLMRRLDGYSSTEISKRFAISVSAVEKQTSRTGEGR